MFRVKSGFFRSTGRLPEPPGNLMGLIGPRWKRGEEARAGPRAAPPVRIGQGEGAAPPLPSSPPPFPPSSPSPTWKGGGVLLPVGVGLLLARLSSLGRRPPPCSFIYGGRGAPLDTQLINDLLAVCGAPSTILHLDNIVAELRRSPASVEHHHRHHTVVLTKLSLNTRLDRSSRDVIELNVC